MDRVQAAMNGTNCQEPTQEMVGFHASLLGSLLRRTNRLDLAFVDTRVFLVGVGGCACAGRCSHLAQQSWASRKRAQATEPAAAAHNGRFVLQARMRPGHVR